MIKTVKIVAVLMVTLACVFATVAFLFGPGISRYRPNPIRRYPADVESPKTEAKSEGDTTPVSDPDMIPSDLSRDS